MTRRKGAIDPITAAAQRAAATSTTPANTYAHTLNAAPKRFTVDLPATEWADAHGFCGRLSAATMRKVNLSRVVRALLAELTATEEHDGPEAAARADELSKRVQARMEAL